ncbi:DUF3667 domain-containing protein [Flavobacterium caeni]|uniref:DUF3667 domain-containing protein n=1 Tax=Flavobacterium caeni TaxID=490189 RepID=A0A1G5HM96_9FLAO|nr:DUF3667 domain-containing protein [Flavobacterium caeni]SCY64985.1 Protein of unknown function [Flavobacterium caeni]
MTCKNCQSEYAGNFCPNCGQPAQLKRIDGHYIIHEIEHVLHFEKGILFTVRELLVNPGKNIRDFFVENRSRLVKPIIFIIITSLIYSITSHFFHIEEGYVVAKGIQKSSVTAIFAWVQQHYGYANIIMGVFIVLWLQLFFRKSGYNFFEILILLCFVMGMGMLIFALFAFLQGLTHANLMTFAGIAGFAYCTWAIGEFFGRKPMNYFKAFWAYALGYLTFCAAAFALGNLIDLAIK